MVEFYKAHPMKYCSYLLLFALLFSCSVQKRKYQPGFYVNWHSKNNQQKKNELPSPESVVKEQREKQADAHKNAQVEELLTSDAGFKNAVLSPKKASHFISETPDTCDVIMFKDGTELRAVVKEIGLQDISYHLCDLPNGLLYRKQKSEVFMIKYMNGKKETFEIKPPNKEIDNIHPYDPSEARYRVKRGDKYHPLAPISFILTLIGIPIFIIVFLASTTFVPYLIPVIIEMAALITANISKKKIHEKKDIYKGKGFTYLALIFSIVLFWIFLIFFFAMLVQQSSRQ